MQFSWGLDHYIRRGGLSPDIPPRRGAASASYSCSAVKMAVITLFISTSYLGAISSLRGPRRDRFGLRCEVEWLKDVRDDHKLFVFFRLGPSNQRPSGPSLGLNSEGSNLDTNCSLLNQSTQQLKSVHQSVDIFVTNIDAGHDR